MATESSSYRVLNMADSHKNLIHVARSHDCHTTRRHNTPRITYRAVGYVKEFFFFLL